MSDVSIRYAFQPSKFTMSTHKILFSLTAEQHAILKAQADRVGIPLTAQLRIAVQFYLDKQSAAAKETKPDPKAHLREAYEAHVAKLDRSLLSDLEARGQWQTHLAKIQRAWGPDGAIVLPFPQEQWNALDPFIPPSGVLPKVDEDPEAVFADIRKLFNPDELKFDE